MRLRKAADASAGQERLEVMDALRGLALCGILLVNIELIHSPKMYAELAGISLWDDPLSRSVEFLLALVAEGKFYPLFSFLFGFGFMLFMERAAARNDNGRRRFMKRLFALFIFGLAHLLFVWWGDILTWYALTGLLLPAFFASRPRTLIIWAFSLLCLFIVFTFLSVMLSLAAGTSAESAELSSFYEWMLERSQNIYPVGGYMEISSQRMIDTLFMMPNMVVSSLFLILPMFLFGMAAAKSGWVHHISQHLRTVRRIGVTALVIGIVFTSIKLWSQTCLRPNSVTFCDMWNTSGMVIGDFSLSVFYIVLVLLLYARIPTWKGWRALASTGRMSLTHYLMQSVVCTSIFYGYGLGLYGQVRPPVALGIAVLLFAVQMVLSRWWMKRFAHGPLEWLWRKWTYSGKVSA